jgi:hypothetical protein
MAIGGYFELELNDGYEYHTTAIRLNSGRNAFEYILRAKGYIKIYLPYYVCDAMLQPITKLGLSYQQYRIDENLEPRYDLLDLKKDEAFVYINYFGLKDKYIETLVKQKPNVIIDNAQAFFSRPKEAVDTFYSARKFFGVPDGAYLYTDTQYGKPLKHDYSNKRFTHLIRRIEYGPEKGYRNYVENEGRFNNLPLRKMSNLTLSLLKSINYPEIARRRRENYFTLEKGLGHYNIFKYIPADSEVPMLYPFFTEADGIRDYLIREKVFIPQYWPNVLNWTPKNTFEYKLANNLIPLPVDQRYSLADMKRVIDLVERFIADR